MIPPTTLGNNATVPAAKQTSLRFVIALVVIVAITCGGIYAYSTISSENQKAQYEQAKLELNAFGNGTSAASNRSEGFFDKDAKPGQASYKTDEEKQTELDRVVEDGMINISIASFIEFENSDSEATAYIENVPANKYVIKVTITLDDTNDIVYESGGIKPDYNIENIKLMKDIDAGRYPATATFAAYQPDTLEEVGQAEAKITIYMKN